MDPKPHNGGREFDLNKISTPAVQPARPVFFRLAKSEGQEPLGELAEVRESTRQQPPAKFFHQTLNPLNL
jgi:hypothetical protein